MSERIATKYCFRAKVTVLNPAKKPIGAYVAYGKTLKVAERAEVTCQLAMPTDFPEGCVCLEPEVTVFEECPVEVSSEVFFEIFEENVT